LVRESVPTELLTDKEVWEALLEKMPITAMIRNLGNMSKNELLVAQSDAEKLVYKTITDPMILKKGRVHPIQILMAMKTYEGGHGLKGKGTWTPSRKVVDGLDEAFYLAFANVETTNKRHYLGLDISGSMWGGVVAGCEGLTPAIASGAMACVSLVLGALGFARRQRFEFEVASREVSSRAFFVPWFTSKGWGFTDKP
jgi:60 kDa SS-A/Ro ribonucleoprotein